MDIFSLAGRITVNYADAVRGIDEVSSRAGGLASTLDRTVQDAGEKITSVGTKISSAGKAISPLSVAVGGVATAAFKTSLDFDSAMSKVGAVSGATGKNFEDLRNKAIEMGGKTKFSASEAAEAFNYMAMAGWKTKDMLGGIEGIMNLAAASGEDLATTSDIVTDALTAFGLSAGDSGHFANVLAAAATSANTDVGKMGETFKYAAPVMGALGYSVEDTSLAIGLMGDSSIKAGMAGTVLRSSFARLTNPTKDMVESMIACGLATQETGVDQEKLEKAQRKVEKATLNVEKAQVSYNQAVAKYGVQSPQAQKALLGVQQKTIDLEQAQSDLEKVQNTLVGTGEIHNLVLNDENGNARSLREVMIFLRESLGGLDEQQQAAAVSAIFGTEAMSGMLAIINASDKDFNELASAIDNCKDKAKDISDTMQDNLAGQLTELKSKLGTLSISIVDLFTPALRNIVGHVLEFVEWLIRLDDKTKTLIGTIAMVVAAAGPVLITIGKVISAVGSIIGVVGKVIGIGGKLVGGIGKVITIVLKIVGVVSTVIGFITGTVIPVIGTIVSAIGIVPIAIAAAIATVIGGIVLLWNKCEWFRETVIAIWEAIKAAAIAVWSAIKDFLINLWDGIVQVGKTVFEGFASFLSTCWQGIQTMFSTVLSAISTLFSTIWNAIKTVVTTVGTAIQTFLTTAWNTIKTVLTTILKAIQTVFSTVWNAIKTMVTTVTGAIKDVITTVWNAIKSTVTNVLNAIKAIISAVWNTCKSIITSAVNAIKSVITNVFNAIKSTITNILNAIKSVITNVWNGIKNIVTNVLNSIKSVITSTFNAIKTVITNVLNGIKNIVTTVWNAIKSTVSTITNVIKTVISTTWNAIKSIVTTVVGAIQNFITTAWNVIKSVVTSTMNAIQSVVSNVWNGVKNTISNVVNGIRTTISNGLEGAKSIASNVLEAIKNKFSNIFDGAINIVKSAIDKIKGFFNFSWSLPKIKLPHFSISGKFSLNPPSTPKIGVQWYAKAMRDGMIMNQPTIFGYNAKSNQLLAGGEAGSETVVGTESLMNMIRSAVASENGELVSVLKQILEAITDLDDGLGKKFYEALLNLKFQINDREFARLVRAV